MRVGLMQEGHCPPGTTWYDRYHEMIVEAQLADEVGFDIYGNGEQHFGMFTAIVSSPEVTHAHLAALTERIRLRPMSVNMIPFNHPIRIAEQTATIDVISRGRAELGGARSNNPWTLDAFGIPATVTAAHRDETLRIVGKAFSGGEFEHHSDLYDIPPRRIAPQPVQESIPIHISATGVESHTRAGRIGIGVMTGNSILGWDYAQECIDAYRVAIKDADPVGPKVTNKLGFFSTGVNCATDRDEARAIAAPVALRFVEVVVGIYKELSKRSKDYAYLGQITKIEDHMDDIDYLVDAAPYITVGNPDDLIERAAQLHEMGADDVLWRVDGMGHENNMKAIEMIGRHVVPALHDFSDRKNSTESSGERSPSATGAQEATKA